MAPHIGSDFRGGNGEGAKPFEQVQEPVARPNSEGFAERQRQRLLAERRRKTSAALFPKQALDKGFQPPLAPAFQRPPIHSKALPQNPHPLRGEPVAHGRDQNHHKTPVNPASQKANGRRRVPLATPVLVAAITMAINLLGVLLLGSKCVARLALVIGAMEHPRTKTTALLATHFRQIRVVFFQKLAYLVSRQVTLTPILSDLDFHNPESGKKNPHGASSPWGSVFRSQTFTQTDGLPSFPSPTVIKPAPVSLALRGTAHTSRYQTIPP